MVVALEWLITVLGLASTWLLSRRNRYGWIANAASQVVWLYVAVVTRQWAFVIPSFAYGYLCIRGWIGWSDGRSCNESGLE